MPQNDFSIRILMHKNGQLAHAAWQCATRSETLLTRQSILSAQDALQAAFAAQSKYIGQMYSNAGLTNTDATF
jgi:hypothetical protein